jgi:hypothetical protein
VAQVHGWSIKQKAGGGPPQAFLCVTPVFIVLSNYRLEEYAVALYAECDGQKDEVESRNGIPIEVDSGPAIGSDEQQVNEGNIKGDHYAKNL